MNRPVPSMKQIRASFKARVADIRKRDGIGPELARQATVTEFRLQAQKLLDDSLRLRDATITMDVDDPEREPSKAMSEALAAEGAMMLRLTYSVRSAKR